MIHAPLPDTPSARRLERIPVEIFADHAAISTEVAERIAALARERAASGRRAVLGLATGSTPPGIYRELIRLHREEGLDLSNVVTFNLDEMEAHWQEYEEAVEFLNPAGDAARPNAPPGLQVDGTVEVTGGSSTDRWKTDKLSLRLRFRGGVDVPAFDDSPTRFHRGLMRNPAYAAPVEQMVEVARRPGGILDPDHAATLPSRADGGASRRDESGVGPLGRQSPCGRVYAGWRVVGRAPTHAGGALPTSGRNRARATARRGMDPLSGGRDLVVRTLPGHWAGRAPRPSALPPTLSSRRREGR